MKQVLWLLISIFFVSVFNPPRLYAQVPTDPNLKVAFIGDTGYGTNFTNVLNLIKNEGAQAVLHQGDFDYAFDPDGFFAKVDTVLGGTFPYFASVGNHDVNSWNDGCSDADGCYATFLKQRMQSIGVTPDDPNLNDQMYAVTYKGLKMVFVGEDSASAGNNIYAPYINNQLSNNTNIWKVCSWHKNQKNMQLGGKGDEMGWNVYENCRIHGALIATAHEHSYQRTKTLTDIDTLAVDTTQHPLDGSSVPQNPNNLLVGPGKTFVFVSGLSGNSIRNQDRCLPTTYPYGGEAGCNYIWAKAYTSDQGATYGALFITFNAGGNPNKATGYFKTVNGQVIDSFEINKTGSVSPSTGPSPTAQLTPTPSKTPTPILTLIPTVTTTPTPTLGNQIPTPTSGQSSKPLYQTTVTGGSTDLLTVSTSAPVPAMVNALYVAAVSSKGYKQVENVTGMGLNWTKIAEQCGGRGQAGVALFSAYGSPSTAGTVTATYESAPVNAVIAVTLYTNTATQPIGAVNTANTVGTNGGCSGGIDSPTYSLLLPAQSAPSPAVVGASSVVFAAVGDRGVAHNPGSGFVERTEFSIGGSAGDKAGLVVVDMPPETAQQVNVNGTFGVSGTTNVDWAVAAVEIKSVANTGVVYDLDGDNNIDFLDWWRVIVNFNGIGVVDFNSNGRVDIFDFSQMLKRMFGSN